MTGLKNFAEKAGLPRLIIGSFFIVLIIVALALGLNPQFLFSDIIRRWMMYSILVLAMVPGVQCGIGLNFGISLGVVSGLLGAVIAMEVSFVNGWFYHFGAGGNVSLLADRGATCAPRLRYRCTSNPSMSYEDNPNRLPSRYSVVANEPVVVDPNAVG